MEMKKLLESLQECGIEESPMAMPPAPMPEDKGDPVRMNVNISAAGKDHVEDLLGMMKNAGLGDAKPVTPDMMPMRTDMERLRDIVDGPKDMDDLKPGDQDEPCPKCGKQHIGASSCMDSIETDDDSVEEFANSPEGSQSDPEYKDTEYMTKDLSGGLNKEKKAYKKAQDGDNAMAVESIKDQLYNLLSEKKAKPDFLDMDKDGDKKEPMKKALKDKKKKTTEGRGKVMAGRGRGKDKLMAGRGRGKKVKETNCPECGKPGKKKLMACSSCGCS